MDTLVICTAALILATKALDCLTTLAAVPTAAAETNPLARGIMHRLGIRRTTALVFAMAAALTCTVAAVVLMMDSTLYAALFIVAGLFVATVQAAVAHTNWTGGWNAITSRVLRAHQSIAKLAKQLRQSTWLRQTVFAVLPTRGSLGARLARLNSVGKARTPRRENATTLRSNPCTARHPRSYSAQSMRLAKWPCTSTTIFDSEEFASLQARHCRFITHQRHCHTMDDLDELRTEEDAARLRLNAASLRVRSSKTPEAWRAEIPKSQSFPLKTDQDVVAEIQRIETIRTPAHLASALRGRFDHHEFLRRDAELRLLDEQPEHDSAADKQCSDRRTNPVILRHHWHVAAGKAQQDYVNYLKNRGVSPERLARHIDERVLQETSAEREALRIAQRRVAFAARQIQEQSAREAKAQRAHAEHVAQAAAAPWLRALEAQTEYWPPSPDSHDCDLVQLWTREIGDDFPGPSGYLSARLAERVALGIYTRLYGDAEDLSIMQVTRHEDNRWQTADILTRHSWIDVKNARSSYSSPSAYSEHCVPAFKANRDGNDVLVSGFLSPYVVCDEPIEPMRNRRIEEECVVWLGETSRSAHKRLRDEFGLLLPIDSHRLPPWLFDYPSAFYQSRDTALDALRHLELPASFERIPVGAFILGEQVLPGGAANVVSESTHLATRIARMGLSRPVLFLHVLDRFCLTMREGRTFPAQDLNSILFPASVSANGPDATVSRDVRTAPLAVADPLRTVSELVRVLANIAQACGEAALRFDEFRLAGIGVFQGRRQGDARWTTLFAHCGGWTNTPSGAPVRCGRAPIYLGQEQPCQRCGRLACSTCGYCSPQCR